MIRLRKLRLIISMQKKFMPMTRLKRLNTKPKFTMKATFMPQRCMKPKLKS